MLVLTPRKKIKIAYEVIDLMIESRISASKALNCLNVNLTTKQRKEVLEMVEEEINS